MVRGRASCRYSGRLHNGSFLVSFSTEIVFLETFLQSKKANFPFPIDRDEFQRLLASPIRLVVHFCFFVGRVLGRQKAGHHQDPYSERRRVLRCNRFVHGCFVFSTTPAYDGLRELTGCCVAPKHETPANWCTAAQETRHAKATPGNATSATCRSLQECIQSTVWIVLRAYVACPLCSVCGLKVGLPRWNYCTALTWYEVPSPGLAPCVAIRRANAHRI